jgi:AcrR family transcriptional regulator
MEEKKEHVLKIAEGLFASNGYRGTTTRMIAQASSVNLGSLTYYFGTKEDLFKELIRTRIGFYKTNIKALVENKKVNYLDLLLNIGNIYVDQMMNNIAFHQIMNKEILTDSKSETAKFATKYIIENRKQLSDIVNKGIKAKQIRKVDTEMFLHSLIGTILHLVNTECMTLKIMGQNPEKTKINSHKNVKRIKSFVHDYISNYLNPSI